MQILLILCLHHLNLYWNCHLKETKRLLVFVAVGKSTLVVDTVGTVEMLGFVGRDIEETVETMIPEEKMESLEIPVEIEELMDFVEIPGETVEITDFAEIPGKFEGMMDFAEILGKVVGTIGFVEVTERMEETSEYLATVAFEEIVGFVEILEVSEEIQACSLYLKKIEMTGMEKTENFVD